jgi:hypothetical protein
MTSYSLPGSRKASNSLQKSDQEKFYQTRELFKRNKKFIHSYIQNQEQEQDMQNSK